MSVGDAKKIYVPDLERERVGPGRLRGLRLIHTHLKEEKLSQEDINDLALLKLDYLTAAGVTQDGLPGQIYSAHLLPPDQESRVKARVLPATDFEGLEDSFADFINSLEQEFSRKSGPRAARAVRGSGERAIIVTVAKKNEQFLDESIAEVRELALSCGVLPVDTFNQYRHLPDPKFLIGRGKLEELILKATELDARLIIFNQNLNPGLARRISDIVGIKIIDRTQLILDVFAQRAKSSDGKLQVELAQLKYTLPRLIEKDTMMSRLTGGIGGRGPGETKLEINRRRAEERVNRLEKEIEKLSMKRAQKRMLRKRSRLSIVSIVGYTNAGKSTLLNSLTESSVIAEDRPFSTLDPASRRLRFPKERELIITDTVGFIRDLPEDLINAFRATLEEIGDASLILHIVDISDSNYKTHIESVEGILKELDFHLIPRIKIYNKIDKMPSEEWQALAGIHGAIPICAMDRKTLQPLTNEMERLIWLQPVNS